MPTTPRLSGAVYATPRNLGALSANTSVDGTAPGDVYCTASASLQLTPTGSPLGRRMVIEVTATASITVTLGSVAVPSSGGPTSASLSVSLTNGQTAMWPIAYSPARGGWVLNAPPQVFG